MLARYFLFLLSIVLPATAQPNLVVSAGHLDFRLNMFVSQAQQTLTVASSGPGEIDFQIRVDPSAQLWLTAAPLNSRTPATITVSIAPELQRARGSFFTITPSRGSLVVVPVTYENWFPGKPLATLSADSITLTTTQGVGNPAEVVLLNWPNGQFSYSATAVSDANWLRVNGNYGGAGSASMNIGCACLTLPVGNYSGVINVIAQSLITLPVTLKVSPPADAGLSASSRTLNFDYQVGGSTPAPQSIAISSTLAGAGFRSAVSTQSGNWLSATPASATTPASISVSVNPSGLAPAAYSGTVTLTPNSGAAITIPVTFSVRAAAPITASATSLSFSYRQGDPMPASQTIQVSGGGASPAFTVQAPDTATWLKPTPLSGTAPATINVSVDPGKLAAGVYQANLTITGTGSAAGTITVPITLQVIAPLPTIAKIVNAASYAEGSISPGEIVTIFGSAIGPDTLAGLALDSSGRVASTLGGVQVLFDGLPAPLIYVSKSQIAAVGPYEIAGRQDTTVQVSWSGQRSNGVTLSVTTTAPGIFTANSSGTGPGAIAHADGSINSPATPAAAGDTVVVYVTGEGQTSPKGVTGKVITVSDAPPLTPAPVLPVAVWIGGQPAQFSFAGEAPGFVSGVMQLNVQIPVNARTGDLPIIVSVGGNSSLAGVTVSVK